MHGVLRRDKVQFALNRCYERRTMPVNRLGFPLRWLLVIFWVAVILLLTLLPGTSPVMRRLTRFFATETMGAIGHAALFGSFTLVAYFGLSRYMRRRWALLLVMAAGLAIGTGTELYQMHLAWRAATMTDLLANYLGVFSVAFLILLTRLSHD